jgi:hypothetical protein
MENVGVINESLESKRLLFNEVKARLKAKQEIELLSIADFIERDKIVSTLDDRAVTECRKIIVQKYLSYLINA